MRYACTVLLPPYNTLWAQVVHRGNPPQFTVSGISVEYRVLNNTSSANKTHGQSVFGQFWTNCASLFGAAVDTDKGLNLGDPAVRNGLSGAMLPKTDHFQANGIPVTPVDDSGAWNPYQIAEINVINSPGSVIARTRTTTPTSDEINCVKCHGGSNITETLTNILNTHPEVDGGKPGTGVNPLPVLCANCHESPHAMVPASRASDNYQAMQYQNSAKSIGSCGACRPNSRGDPRFAEFVEAHAGTSYEGKNPCHICRTAVSTDTTKWPHKFQWKIR